MTMTNYIIEEIMKMDRLTLNRVIDVVRVRQRQLSEILTLNFKKGDRVSFTGRYGVPLTGTVTKVNRKTVAVIDIHDTGWRISPSLLTKIND